MRSLIKAIIFIAASALFFLIAVATQIGARVLSRTPGPSMARLTEFWGSVMITICGITVKVNRTSDATPAFGSLIVSNHQSYIDIIVIASVIPTLFVAKKEVQSWPVLGWLAWLGGTVFVNRSAFRGASVASFEIVSLLRRGTSVQVFPEGTSSDGSGVLPFRPSLFRSAIVAGAPVQPLTLNYTEVDGQPFSSENRDIICWYGDTTFVQHFWTLLSCRSITAELTFSSALKPPTDGDARTIAAAAQDSIRSHFRPLAVEPLPIEMVF